MKRAVALLSLCCLWLNAFALNVSNKAELANVEPSKPSATTIRIGVQVTGTLAWELALLQSGDKLKNTGFNIEKRSLATPEAGKIALQSGAVDMIVSDWIWVSRMRSDEGDLSFYPYSTVSGALLVSGQSAIKTIGDLKGKRLGIAGGALDKNWLLLQALAQQEKVDLSDVETVFGAPPLIDEQIKQGRVDAVLNYWHFGAKLEAQGYRQVVNGQEIIEKLGIKESVPTLGYVFKLGWATQHKAALTAFLNAAKTAKKLLCTSDKDWQKIIPLLQTDDLKTQAKLRQRYCEGEIKQWGDAEKKALERLYVIFRKVSQNQLTGKAEHLQPGIFWQVD